MAESKTSISSKGGANVLAKRVQKKFSRAQEKVLQKLGKSDETKDEHFEQCVINLQDQQNDAYRIHKDLKAYLNAVRVMRDVSSRLFQSLFDAYDPEWDGAEDLGVIVEGEDLLWSDYEGKLRDQALLTMDSYMSQFPDVRERVAKRGRKLVDYDSARHHLTVLKNAKKKDDIKIGKADDEMKAAKTTFEDINRELKEELPILFDSRIGCYVTAFQAVSNLRDIFYKEMTKNNLDLQTVMKELREQHPDKTFLVKNFNRSGSLKRRSFRDTLSPRSLKTFYDLHTTYSPRSSLRRENSSSFRSDKPKYEPYSPTQISPTRPKPHYINVPHLRDTETTSIHYPKEEDVPSHEHQVNDTTEDEPVEDEKKENESSTATNQDRPEDSLVSQDDSSSSENESELQANSSPTKGTEIKTTAASDVCEEHKKMEEPSGMENGIAPDKHSDVEQIETSQTVSSEESDHSSGKGKEN
ncbi:bridging integrator 2a [Triplophysa dalaica]|uniref:bridging integrator 2a n=1 Tax=Triplophysa dalaica TaxID=1582913 RepID=UPI0024DFC3F4|nr:bridging integrator 2a [Triplophysa dalaica]